MTFRSSTQPFCRWCARPIRKDVRTHFPRRHGAKEAPRVLNPQRAHDVVCYTREDCQRQVNESVISVVYSKHGEDGPRYVASFNTWDGESYVDQFFCTNRCAQALGYAAARDPHRLCSEAYRKAVAKAEGRS